MRRTLLLMISLLITGIVASATVIPVGTASPGITPAVTPLDPMTVGTLVVTTGPVSFSFGGTAIHPKNTGWVVETVRRAPTGNLLFIFQVHVSGGPSGDVERLSTGDWGLSVGINAFQYQDGGDVTAVGVDRNTGGTLGINFNPLVEKGDTSWEVVLYTSTPNYIPGSIGVIDTGSNPSIPGWVATPEPATLSFLAFGLGALMLRRRRQ